MLYMAVTVKFRSPADAQRAFKTLGRNLPGHYSVEDLGRNTYRIAVTRRADETGKPKGTSLLFDSLNSGVPYYIKISVDTGDEWKSYPKRQLASLNEVNGWSADGAMMW